MKCPLCKERPVSIVKMDPKSRKRFWMCARCAVAQLRFGKQEEK
jgi:hypothetical protein